ncbi:MAG: hypothetical protein HYZ27_04105 [Deltaproteobacteria bacterium]|nr:hypothetical protein [Deltaproteobacteria bacterium]
MLQRYLFACICITGLAACDAPESNNGEPPGGGSVTVPLNRNGDGSLEYCDADGNCQDLPYTGDCAIIEITIDTATGQTCQTCITADNTRIDEGCSESLIACVVVTLPNPDCVVCAYINGDVIYSTCTAQPPEECYTVCRSDGNCCEQCNDPYGRPIYDSCMPDCSTVLCAPVQCDPGYEARRPPGECCDYCVPIDDCSQTVCPMINPIPDCPPGSTLVRDPADCCSYYCKPTDCAVAPRPDSGDPSAGGNEGAPMFMCGSNDECYPGEVCVNGACMALCNSSTDCPSGARCVEGVCEYDSFNCTSDADCGAGLLCRNGVCVSDCPPGYHFEEAYPYCGQCVPDQTEVYCYSDMDCLDYEYCSFDSNSCSYDSAGGDPNLIACMGVCRPRETNCDATTRPMPMYCEGWIETQYDANGCPYYVCVCPDGTTSLDGACPDQCTDVFCTQVVIECDPGYHLDYSYPYCCGRCVPDEYCDATTGEPNPSCAAIECAPGYHQEIDPRTCCPICVADTQACLSDADCAAGQVCDMTQCNPPPGCDPNTEVCITMCYGGCVQAECTTEECGPSPGMPNYLCPDGSVGGPTGRCLRNDDGSCGWEIVDCPSGTCTDYDGADPYTASGASQSTETSIADCFDSCSTSGSAVIECICTTDGNLVTTAIDCANGCSDGACVR